MLSIEACYELLLRWAALGLLISGIAALAVRLVREPARRIRIIQAALLGLAVLPLLLIAPGYPRLAVLPSADLLDEVPPGVSASPSPLVGEGGLRSKPGEGAAR